MRAYVAGTWIAMVVAASGCSSRPLPASCFVDAGADAGATCGPPPAPRDPSAIDDMAEFREVASALVCERALGCGEPPVWAFAGSYCHPRFAELQAFRAGGTGVADLTVARAALEALIEAPTCELAYDAAQRCRMLMHPCTRTTATDERNPAR